ncbi:MAG: PQQ-like beta-propeller repeat protein [Planctomycetes bacterium]|nr:PQQ-like beta-propeller repeat protein [Planctomycetota bacterium]
MMLLFLALTVASPFAVAEDHWTQFRGPNGTGLADAAGLPVTWSEADHVAWKTPIHDKGWSSPVIWNGQIWLTTARADGKEMFAVCVDRRTGKILHDLKVFEVEHPAFAHPVNSYASPTPAIEAGRVYVHFGTYGTACLDTTTGKVLWTRRDLLCNHFRGPGSSPILYGGLLIVHFDGFDAQYVVALDKNTGRTVWKKDRDIRYADPNNGDLKKAFGTPSIVEVNGRAELISPAATATTAYDPLTGQELWRIYHGGMNVTAPPLYGQGLLFLCTGDGGYRLLAVRPDGQGDLSPAHVVWKQSRGVPSRSSPLLLGDDLYMVNESGMATCLDAATGRQVWQKRLGGQFFASPIYADGRLYCFNDEGTGYVMQPGRQPKLLAVNKLDDGCMATPAAAGQDLIVRTRTHLYCLRQKP